MRIDRLALAVVATMLALPCLGFGVFGMLASFDVTVAERWTAFAIYATSEVGMLVGVFLLWRWALVRRDPRLCERCGYDLTGTRGSPCPECGARPEFERHDAT